MTIIIKLSDLLLDHKINMRQLSLMTGIRPNTISNLYYGTAKQIRLDQIEAICQALNCRVEDIFEYTKD